MQPQPPFTGIPLTDRNGLLLSKGCFYGWEIGGALLSGSKILNSSALYADLPGNVVELVTPTYTLPAYQALGIDRQRYAANNEAVSFWFLIDNDNAGAASISPGLGWTLTAFTLAADSSALVLVLDNGVGCDAFLAGITTSGGGGSVTSISAGAVGAQSGTSELSFLPSPIVGAGSIALATSAAAGVHGSGTNVPQITISAGGRVVAVTDVPIPSTNVTSTTLTVAGSPVAPGGSVSVDLPPSPAGGAYLCPQLTISPQGIVTGATDNFTKSIVAGTGISVTGDARAFYLNATNCTVGLANTTVVAGPYGDSTHVATFTVDAQGRLTAAGSVAISGAGFSPITVTSSGPITITGSPVSLGGTVNVGANTSGVTPGVYTAANITVDTYGRVTNAASALTKSVAAGTGIQVTNGAGFYASGAVNATIGLANTSVTAASYGSSTQVATFTVDAQGRLTTAANVAISGASLGSITVNTVGPLTAGGSPVALGGTLTLTDTALNSVATRNWKAGSSSALGAITDSVAVGDTAYAGGGFTVAVGSNAGSATNDRSVVIGYQAGINAGTDFLAIGYQAGKGVGATNSCIVGNSAGVSTTGGANAFFGAGTGFYVTTGTNNTAIGHGAGPLVNAFTSTSIGAGAASSGSDSNAVGVGAATSAGTTGANAYGKGASATANYTNAIGWNVTNSTPNTSLIGDNNAPTAHIVKSTGQLQSGVQEGAAAGWVSGDPAQQTIASGATTTLNIQTTRYADGGAVVALAPISTIQLITLPNHYVCTALVTVSIPAASNGSTVVLTLQWSSNNGVTWQTLGQNIAVFANGSLVAGCTVTTAMKSAAGSANFIRAQLFNNTSQTATVTLYRLSNARQN